MMRGLGSHTFLLIFCAITALGTSACLDRKQAVVIGARSTASSSSAGFTGAVSANNLTTDGLSIQVNWVAATAPYTTYTVYQVDSQGNLLPIKSKIPLSQTSFTQSGLSSGVVYSFVVRSVKPDKTDDGNLNIVSAIAYAGVNVASGVTGLGLNQATISFPAAGASAEGVAISCQNGNGIATFNYKLYSQTATSYGLTGLYSGTTYNCIVNLIYPSFFAPGESIDNNAATLSFQTISQGYTASTPAYRGVILVQAYGDAPSAPTAATAPAAITNPVSVPTQRQVSITWKSFNVALPLQAQYRVVRVAQGGVLDMNSTAICTSTTTTACQVCISTSGTGPLSRTCSQNAVNIGKSPTRYEYAVSLIVNPNSNPPLAEELPATDAPFRILVPIPPDNMVLVHRDSVNYEICTYMGGTTPFVSPGVTIDPLNHNRCVYSGLGAIPFNSGAFFNPTQTSVKNSLGVADNPGTNYDFGYNLFIDRFEEGCNWTPSPTTSPTGTGMCNPLILGTAGDCFGSGPPLAGQGVAGNVYFDTFNVICNYKTTSGWVTASAASSSAAFLAMMTNVPSLAVQKPPLTAVGPIQANNFCQSSFDPTYGPKRVLTRREQVASSGLQWMPGEPGEMSQTAIAGLMGNVSLLGTQGCNMDYHNGLAQPATLNLNEASPGSGWTPITAPLMIGSHYTAACVSRFGAQDMIGNAAELLSDYEICTVATHSCVGGSKDLNFIKQYNFDGVTGTGPGGTAQGQGPANYTDWWNISTQKWNTNYFNVPMGLPYIGPDGGNAIPTSSVHSSDAIGAITIFTDNANGVRYFTTMDNYYTPGYFSGSRFAVNMSVTNYGGAYEGFRCALPAE